MDKNKKVRLYVNGIRRKDIYQHKTKWEIFKLKVKRMFARLIFLSIIVGIGYGIFTAGRYINPPVVYTKQEVIKEVPVKAPIMDMIADCESGKRLPNGRAVKGSARHYGLSGQVLMTGNTNKSVDVGKYAINSVWFSKATEMGLDITKEEDNKKMAQWIYENRGTEDYYSSKSCWGR